jgi:CRP-like cAMP-binding protein
MKSDQPITADNAYERSRKNSLFEGLNKEQIAALFSISREMTLEKDGFLMREGDPAEEIYLILEGELEISRYDAKHRQNHTIATLKAGQCAVPT